MNSARRVLVKMGGEVVILMLHGEGPLGVMALTALALAGFTGVVVVFQQSKGKWAPQNLRATQLIFEHTIAIVFASFLPFPLFYALETSKGVGRVWQLSSIAFALSIALLAGAQARRIFGGDVKPRCMESFVYAYFPLCFGIFALQIVNALTLRGPSAYLLAELVLLFAPAVQFWFLVRFAIEDEDAKRAATVQARRDRGPYQKRREVPHTKEGRGRSLRPSNEKTKAG